MHTRAPVWSTSSDSCVSARMDCLNVKTAGVTSLVAARTEKWTVRRGVLCGRLEARTGDLQCPSRFLEVPEGGLRVLETCVRT